MRVRIEPIELTPTLVLAAAAAAAAAAAVANARGDVAPAQFIEPNFAATSGSDNDAFQLVAAVARRSLLRAHDGRRR